MNYFFEALRFLMSENSTSNIRQLMKLRLDTAQIQKLAQLYFARYYDQFLLDELKLKDNLVDSTLLHSRSSAPADGRISGDRLLFFIYEVTVRYGTKCLRKSASLNAVTNPAGVPDVNVRLICRDFQVALESVLQQYVEACALLFSLDDVSTQKLRAEL